VLELPALSDRPSAESPFDQSARLADGVLLLHGHLGAGGTAPSVTLVQGERALAVPCQRFDYLHQGEVGTLLMIFIPREARALHRRDSIVIRDGDAEVELNRAAIRRLEADVKTLARERLAPLPADDRARALAFLVNALAAQPGGGTIALSETLFSLRQALRERLPPHVHAAHQPRGISVDSIMAVDDTSFYVSGWLRDEEAEITRFTAVSPEGHRAELAQIMFTYRRPEVTTLSGGVQSRQDPDEKAGFVCFIELDSPSFLSTGWILEMENADGAALELRCQPVLRVAAATRNQILSDASRFRLPDEEMMLDHVMPAMLRIAEQARNATRIESVTTFGEPGAEPQVSIVIPLYQRIDLIEQQFAEFTQDPEIKQADLIYVLDSPGQKDELLELVGRLFPIYEVPCRVAALQRNVGFANAINAGASIAHGRLLLLMNSDVFPDKPGWLTRLASFYESTPKIGALGPKLLYEDGSIQQAGMHLHKPMGSTVWLDAHYFRGLHRDFPDANVARQVPLVSGACLMISRSLFEDLGGLNARYVQGDYEDSDLCMRLSELGCENWYTPDAELYHLEAQSYLADLRMPTHRYNAWLHTHLWRRRLEALAEATDR
jgi:O-antigen biosynthesis protein